MTTIDLPASQSQHDGDQAGGDQVRLDAQYRRVSAVNHASDQTTIGTHSAPVAGAQHPDGQVSFEAQGWLAVGDPLASDQSCVSAPSRPASANDHSTPRKSSPTLADPLLQLAADVLDDLERVRIANENRLRQLTRDETDSDGEERGFGLDESHPDVARLASLVKALAAAEHDAELNLRRLLRRHPLGPWMRAQRGVGEKQGARLLAAIGDPYWNTLHDRPRTVSELWAYCGYHTLPAGQRPGETQGSATSGNQPGGNPDHDFSDAQSSRVRVAATRARGQRANWSATAKMRAYLIAESCLKAGGPYRDVYDTGRAKYADATHHTPCRRCGPAGKPAEVGTPLSKGHQHARALRLVAKDVLLGLWLEARRLHLEES